MMGYATLVYQNLTSEPDDDEKRPSNIIDMQKSSVVIVAGACFLLGVILIGFSLMFLSMGISPDLTKREIAVTE